MCDGFSRSSKDSDGWTVTVFRQFDLVTLGKKGVESKNELSISLKQVGDASDHSRCVYLVCLEGLHNVQELIVDVRSITELYLYLIQIKKGVFHT